MKPFKEALDDYTRELITEALTETNWNYSKAAQYLQTTRRILQYHMNRLKIVRPQDDGE
jgi:transcriptional regulator with GAF, ATPase, and Fis domain